MNKKVVVVETKNLIRAVGIALEYLKRIESKKLQIPGSFLLMIHKPLLANKPKDAGRYRAATDQLSIGGATFTPCESAFVNYRVVDLIDLINNKRKWKKLYEDNFLNKIPPKNLESINDRNLDVIKLIFVSWYVHHALTQIHPFTDGNGRISRLLMCLILKYGGISNESFPPIINYLINKDKSKYLNCLNDADKNNYITGVEYMIEILNKSYIETSKMMKVLAKIGNDKK